MSDYAKKAKPKLHIPPAKTTTKSPTIALKVETDLASQLQNVNSTIDLADSEITDRWVPCLELVTAIGRTLAFSEDVESVTFDVAAKDKDYNLVTSKINQEGDLHAPCIDIDAPVMVIPSATPGHYHLYIDKQISWNDYQLLLHTLSSVGIVEEGYVKASVTNGFSSLRTPGTYKDTTQAPPDVSPQDNHVIRFLYEKAENYRKALRKARVAIEFASKTVRSYESVANKLRSEITDLRATISMNSKEISTLKAAHNLRQSELNTTKEAYDKLVLENQVLNSKVAELSSDSALSW